MKKLNSLIAVSAAFILSLTFNFNKVNANENNIPGMEYVIEKNLKTSDETKVRLIIQIEKEKMEEVIQKIEKIDSAKIRFRYEEIFSGVSLEIKWRDFNNLTKIEGLTYIEMTKVFKPFMHSAHRIVNDFPKPIKYKHDGRGMVVAIVDSGIDINHKDMRLDKGVEPKIKEVTPTAKNIFTMKIPHGYNFIDYDYDKMIDETEKPHGMHVGGIIAANATDEEVANHTGIDGIAPNAQLFMYRVFSDRKDTQIAVIDDTVYASIEDAIKHGADVISLSIGDYGSGKPGDAFYKSVEHAKEKGVVIAASMGNASTSNSSTSYDRYTNSAYPSKDLSTTVSVAANVDVIGVGASRNIDQTGEKAKIDDFEFFYEPVSYSKFAEGNYTLIDAKNGTAEDIKDLDLDGKVAVIGRTAEKPKDIFDRIRNKGAVGVISYNVNMGRNRDFYDIEFERIITENVAKDLWGMTISYNDGQKILDKMKTKSDFSMKNLGVKVESISTVNEMSGFSSWGATVDLELKPEIVAPGENVYSTYNHDRYGSMSGTSMSTPIVAGAAAILLPEYREINKADSGEYNKYLPITDFTKVMMMNTATPLMDTTGFENSPRQQGAGMLNIQAAFENKVLITSENKGFAALKEIGQNKGFDVKLQNLSNESKDFKIRLGGVLTSNLIPTKKRDGKTIQEIHSGIVEGATINGDASTIHLDANESKTVHFDLNTGSANDEFVEGFIYFDSQNKNNPNLVLPYFGFKGDWGKERIIDSPMWEDSSYVKLTGLMTTTTLKAKEKYILLGLKDPSKINDEFAPEQVNDYVDPEKIAISSIIVPKSEDKNVEYDSIIGSAFVRFTVLRDLVDYEIDVVKEKDDNADFIKRIEKGIFMEKFRYIDYFESEYYKYYFSSAKETHRWDGRYYDPTSGKTVSAEEGQYYIRIKARNDVNKPYQYTYLPLKIDNTFPTLTINDDNTFTAEDKNGIWLYEAKLDGKELEVEKINENTYKIKGIETNPSSTNKLSVSVSDHAGNKITKHKVIAENLVSLLYKDEITGLSDIEDITFKISENIKEATIYVNGKQYDTTVGQNKKTNNYEAWIEINDMQEGIQKIRIVGKDESGNVIVDTTEALLRDIRKPDIEFTDVKYEEKDEDDEDAWMYDPVLKMKNGYSIVKGRVSDTATPADKLTLQYYDPKNMLKHELYKNLKVNENGEFELKIYKSDFPEAIEFMVKDLANKKETKKLYISHPDENVVEKPFSVHEVRHNIFIKEENLGDIVKDLGEGKYLYTLGISADSEDYFIKINDGEFIPMGEDYDDKLLPLELVHGANIIDISGYNKDKKLIFNDRRIYYVDVEGPTYSITNLNIFPRLENETDNTIVGTIYISDEDFELDGYAEDDGLGWFLRVNDNIVQRGKAWRVFGENREYFKYKTHLEDNDILKLTLKDYVGNGMQGKKKNTKPENDKSEANKPDNTEDIKEEEADYFEKRFRIKIDKEKPTFENDIKETYKNSAVINIKAKDNIGIEKEVYLLDGKVYPMGSEITEIGNHKLKAVAVDFAGNTTTEEFSIDIIGELGATLSKDEVEVNDVKNIENWLNLDFGTKAKIINIENKDEEATVKVLLYNELGEKLDKTFVIKTYVKDFELPIIDITDNGNSNTNQTDVDENSNKSEQIGWVKTENGWKYKSENSKFKKDEWIKTDNNWYKIDVNANLIQNKWLNENDKWYWLNSDGRMSSSEWVYVDNSWYWANESGGIAQNEWVYVDNSWYWANESGGIAQNEWIYVEGSWYLSDESGKIVQNKWVKINNKWYCFNKNGELYVDTITPDGYRVNSNGEWI